MEYHIIDTETASLVGGVVEFAWLIIDENFTVKNMLEMRVNPKRKIESAATKIHGITDEMVANCQTMDEIFPDMLHVNFIAHNAGFDKRMVADWIQAKRTLDTLKLARRYFPNLSNHKLSTVVEELGLTPRNFHSAMEDVAAVREFLRYTCNYLELDLETLFQREYKPTLLHQMPFGKYKGYNLMALPKDYREWLLSVDIADDLRFSLKHIERIV